MTKITFRQKTEEELQADAAARQKRNPTATKIEEHPSPAVPPPADEPPASEPDAFSLDGERETPRAKKGRKK